MKSIFLCCSKQRERERELGNVHIYEYFTLESQTFSFDCPVEVKGKNLWLLLESQRFSWLHWIISLPKLITVNSLNNCCPLALTRIITKCFKEPRFLWSISVCLGGFQVNGKQYFTCFLHILHNEILINFTSAISFSVHKHHDLVLKQLLCTSRSQTDCQT